MWIDRDGLAEMIFCLVFYSDFNRHPESLFPDKI
jgi:hypothetical protein